MESESEALSQLLQSVSRLVAGNVQQILFTRGSIKVRLAPLVNSSDLPNRSVDLILDPRDFRTVPFTSLREGAYENLITRLLLSFGSSSAVFLDVGSNVGFYSVLLAKIFPELEIHAVEPNPSLWSQWETNLAVNQLGGRCKLYRAGLSLENLESVLYVPSLTGSGGGSQKILHPEEAQREVPISLRTPESLGLPNTLSLVKIDVEGAEEAVVRALEARIRTGKPTIVIELLRKWMAPYGSHPQNVLEMLVALGYRAFAIGTDVVCPIMEITEATPETNFVFIHEENEVHMGKAAAFLENP